tara:strand:+ start:645 stop:1031 length:387 start_codon:yes stop_codon:yes gene_type:complete
MAFTQIAIIDSAVYTATQGSDTDASLLFTRGIYRKAIVYLHVTVIGTGSLRLRMRIRDQTTVLKLYHADGKKILATGDYRLYVGEGCGPANSEHHQCISSELPPVFDIQVTHSDGSDWTYRADLARMD